MRQIQLRYTILLCIEPVYRLKLVTYIICS